MPSTLTTAKQRRAGDSAWKLAAAIGAPASSHGKPLVLLQTQWKMPAHRRYLEAANFHWQL